MTAFSTTVTAVHALLSALGPSVRPVSAAVTSRSTAAVALGYPCHLFSPLSSLQLWQTFVGPLQLLHLPLPPTQIQKPPPGPLQLRHVPPGPHQCNLHLSSVSPWWQLVSYLSWNLLTHLSL